MVALVFIIAAVGGGGIFFIVVHSAVGVLFVGVAARIPVATTRIVSVKNPASKGVHVAVFIGVSLGSFEHLRVIRMVTIELGRGVAAAKGGGAMVAVMVIVMAAVFGTVLVPRTRLAVMAMVITMVAVGMTGVFSTIFHQKNFGLANMLGM